MRARVHSRESSAIAAKQKDGKNDVVTISRAAK